MEAFKRTCRTGGVVEAGSTTMKVQGVAVTVYVLVRIMLLLVVVLVAEKLINPRKLDGYYY